MKALDLKKQNKPPNILFFGPPGGGKTGLASQAAGGYLFDFDDGMRTALTLNDKFTPLRHSIEFDTYVDKDPENPRAYLDAKKKLLQIRAELSKGTWPYDACCIDSLTGMCRAIQLHVMKCSKWTNSFAKPDQNSFGFMVNEVESILTILRALNVLTIVTAHEMLITTDDGSMLIRIMSATKPHGMNKLPWLFDEVLYTKARRRGQGRKEYIVSPFVPDSSARTRSSLNEDIIHNETGLACILKQVGYEYQPSM